MALTVNVLAASAVSINEKNAGRKKGKNKVNADGTGSTIFPSVSSGALWRSPARWTCFVEKIYENALAHELSKRGLAVAQQRGVLVKYDDVVVGEDTTDLLVEGSLLVELKAVRALDNVHYAQCLNYLKATGLRLCLLLNLASLCWIIEVSCLGL